MWGNRVVIPNCLRKTLLQYLHANYPGIVETKATARSYAWWPRIDHDIEVMAKNCRECIETGPSPHKTPTQMWTTPETPWNRIHLDFAGPHAGQTFVIVVDSTTKWLEVERVRPPNSAEVIKTLRRLFVTFGIPDTMVPDNGTAFASQEMKDFCTRNGIKTIFTAPYNSQSNGQAERMVQITNKSLKNLKKVDWEVKLTRILLKQHNVSSTTTGKSPAVMMLGRPLRTVLDKLNPKNQPLRREESGYTNTNIRRLKAGGRLRMRNYRKDGPKWIIAKVTEVLGNRNYIIKERDTGLIHKRDIDQLVQLPPDEPEEHPLKFICEPLINTNFYDCRDVVCELQENEEQQEDEENQDPKQQS